jgi:DNA polymerase (family X)
MDRLLVAAALREIALHLRLRGGPRFPARAYERAARTLESFDGDLGALAESGQLIDLPGVGSSIAAHVGELLARGESAYLARLRRERPPAVLEMGQVREVGAKRAGRLFEELGIGGLDELERACADGRVRTLSGFGPATEERMRRGIVRYRERLCLMPLVHARPLGEMLAAHLRRCPAVSRVEPAGELRRACEAIGRVDLVAATAAPEVALDHFTAHPMVARATARTVDHVELRLATGVLVTLHVAPPERFARAWLAATAAPEHASALRARGLDTAGGATEEAVYGALGLPFLPPEVRDGAGEIEAAEAGERFDDLVQLEDVRGLVHCHTTDSDGSDSVEDMARAAERLGYEYITITDHSPSAHYAGGLSPERLMAQWDEIDRVRAEVGVDILRGTESDINPDGSLDYDDEVLGALDVIVASIHGRHRMDEGQMTERLIAALRSPRFKVWGHALGRIVLRRDPIACRMDEVLAAAARSRAAIEVNGDPWRLDLPPRWIREARKLGIPFVLSTDAHSTRALGNVELAVAMARKGWLRRREVLNALPAAEFRAAVRP